MGNRALITTAPYKNTNPAIYVHWNGGQGSVQAFCNVARDLRVRDPLSNSEYALARLAQIIGNYFGGTLSLGITKAGQDWGCDNGVYTIGEGWQLAQSKGKLAAQLEPIDSLCQYESAQLSKVYTDAMAINAPIFNQGMKD